MYIFGSFEIIGLILSQFENRAPLELVLGGVGTIATFYCSIWTDSIVKLSLLILFLQ